MRRAPTYDDLCTFAQERLGGGPFTTDEAVRDGVGPAKLGQLVRAGVVRRMVKGVYVLATTPDTLQLRCIGLRKVVPDGAVVTDRTAGWLHGVDMVLAPNDHLTVPPVSAFHRSRGGRLRNDLTASGQRMMPETDVTEAFGLLATTPLRTALDLGRLLYREQAFAAMDQMLRCGAFSQRELLGEVERFKGYRGVVQLRALAPLTDRRAESPWESILRLRWIDCPDLPRPEPQVPVPGPGGTTYWLDLGVEGLRIGAEYDGAAWHGPDRREHDLERRAWIEQRRDWILAVFTGSDLRSRHGVVERVLHQVFASRRRRLTG